MSKHTTKIQAEGFTAGWNDAANNSLPSKAGPGPLSTLDQAWWLGGYTSGYKHYLSTLRGFKRRNAETPF